MPNYNFTLVETNTVSYDEDFAKEMQGAREALANAKSTTLLTIDFSETSEAYNFVRMAGQWATDNGLKFTRKAVPGNDNIKDQPLTVAFRVYVPRTKEA